ncbi:hypothetical protein CON64_20045 [Bacillus pseudomycoides]|nr:hypothetical protein CON64_20045 [Bacillus pseudomycoides]
MKKEMHAPVCLQCKKRLQDWKGNVRIKKEEMFDTRVIQSLEIWCKECTTVLDEKGPGREYHNLWELSSVKESYFDQIISLISRMQEKEGLYRFSEKAILDCLHLGRILYDKKIKLEEY